MSGHFRRSSWLVVVGFAIYFASLTFGGWLQGKAMLDPTRDWMESMELTVPYLTGRSVGGPLMVLGHFAFAFNLIAILVGRGAERKAGAGLALCQAGGKGLVATESERFDDGVRATVDDTEVLVGSRGFLSRNGVTPPEEGQHEAGLTAVHMATDGAWVATFLLGDALRPDAAATIAQLRASGLMLGMASGDAPTPCAHVGAAAGLTPSEIHAACTPEVKAELVGAGPGPTAFVGDGGKLADGHRQCRPIARTVTALNWRPICVMLSAISLTLISQEVFL
ncbi:HAD family hydrolase [Marinobacter sp.]|uniref:HAD family hydrolase n=1 Tax=Marinobacter sp. TaxID=50741 RepID=UPI0025C66D04|nr:HAD family hydrolase [Marinobacter sp.]